MASGASFLGAGRDPADHAVKLVADPAERPCEALLLAGAAY